MNIGKNYKWAYNKEFLIVQLLLRRKFPLYCHSLKEVNYLHYQTLHPQLPLLEEGELFTLPNPTPTIATPWRRWTIYLTVTKPYTQNCHSLKEMNCLPHQTLHPQLPLLEGGELFTVPNPIPTIHPHPSGGREELWRPTSNPEQHTK